MSAGNPWEELVDLAGREPGRNRQRLLARDQAIHAALLHGSAPADLASQLGMTTQAIYAAAERAEKAIAARNPAYVETASCVERFSDSSKFEELVTVLLGSIELRVRRIGGQGDAGRDAVAGFFEVDRGEETVVTMSLAAEWAKKIRRDLNRIEDNGWQPLRVLAVTNRRATHRQQAALQEAAAGRGWALTVFDQRWLADQLTAPSNLELRERFLGLPRPKPEFFLSLDEFECRLARQQVAPIFYGRTADIEGLLAALDRSGTLLLEGAGGVGKSRLLAETAARHSSPWFFAPDGMAFENDMVSQLGAGFEAVVVLDDAHRRPDLRQTVAAVERRSPRPRLILVARPGSHERIAKDLDGLACQEVERIALGGLPSADIAELVKGHPLELRFEGLVDAIVTLAAGNPQIALLAGQLASEGIAVHELSRAQLLRSYAASVLRAAAGESVERRELLGSVAALGSIDLRDAFVGERVSQLLGLPAAFLRRELRELAELGLVFEEPLGVFAIKPDILSEWTLAGSFFDPDWKPVFPYEALYEAFVSTHRDQMLQQLGLALAHVSAPEERLNVVRRDLLHRVGGNTGPPLVEHATWSKSLAPGAPALAVELMDALLDQLEGSMRTAVVSELADACQRIGLFDIGWPRLLRLAQIVYSKSSESATRTKVVDAVTSMHRRLPIDMSPQDGAILAGVQHALVTVTEAFWARNRGEPGSAEAVGVASRVMLTVSFETSRAGPVNPTTIRLGSATLPTSDFTRRSLQAGAALFLDTLLRLPPALQHDQVAHLDNFAREGSNFPGAFGSFRSDEVRAEINEILDNRLFPGLNAMLQEFSLPIVAELVELFDWRREHDLSERRLPEPDPVREYRALVYPSRHRHLALTLDEEREVQREHGRAYGRQLISDDWQTVLVRWERWLHETVETLGKRPWHASLGIALESVAEGDLDHAREVAEYLLSGMTELLGYAGPLLHRLVQALDENVILEWLDRHGPPARQAIGRAVTGLNTEFEREVLERLSEDRDQSVREVVRRQLSITAYMDPWRVSVALALTEAEGGLDDLLVILESLDRGPESTSAEVDFRQAAQARRILLKTAADNERRYGYELARAMTLLRVHEPSLPIEWAWQRIEFAREDTTTRFFGVDFPDELATLIADQRQDPEWTQHLRRALDALAKQPRPAWPVRSLLVTLAQWLGGETDDFTSELSKRIEDRSLDLAVAGELLETPSSWAVFTDRARAFVRVYGSDRKAVGALVDARLPMILEESMEHYYEDLTEAFRSWLNDDDPPLADAGRVAVRLLAMRTKAPRA